MSDIISEIFCKNHKIRPVCIGIGDGHCARGIFSRRHDDGSRISDGGGTGPFFRRTGVSVRVRPFLRPVWRGLRLLPPSREKIRRFCGGDAGTVQGGVKCRHLPAACGLLCPVCGNARGAGCALCADAPAWLPSGACRRSRLFVARLQGDRTFECAARPVAARVCAQLRNGRGGIARSLAVRGGKRPFVCRNEHRLCRARADGRGKGGTRSRAVGDPRVRRGLCERGAHPRRHFSCGGRGARRAYALSVRHAREQVFLCRCCGSRSDVARLGALAAYVRLRKVCGRQKRREGHCAHRGVRVVAAGAGERDRRALPRSRNVRRAVFSALYF